VDPFAPKTIYAGTWGHGIWRSTNNGGAWSSAVAGPLDPEIYALSVDPTQANVVYAATHTQGIYRSADRGLNWIQDGLAGHVAYALLVDTSGTAYAGTDGTGDGQGVYKRSALGIWEPMARQPGPLAVRSLARRNSVLLAGTTDGGVWWYELY
jgi:hypothetical protein